MKAIGYRQAGAIDREDCLSDIDLERPVAKGRDLLVAVELGDADRLNVRLVERAVDDVVVARPAAGGAHNLDIARAHGALSGVRGGRGGGRVAVIDARFGLEEGDRGVLLG